MGCTCLRSARLWLVMVCFLALPATAHAHTSFKGLGDFFGGFLHPVVTPTHLLIIVGLGLMLGRKKPPDLKKPMKVFMPLSAVALILTTTGWIKSVYPPALICITLCAATFLALEKTPPPLVSAVLLALAALLMGLDSGVESASVGKVVKTLLGTWISFAVLIVDIAIYVSLVAEKKWVKIALRIAGAWIIAIALMVLAFSLRGERASPQGRAVCPHTACSVCMDSGAGHHGAVRTPRPTFGVCAKGLLPKRRSADGPPSAARCQRDACRFPSDLRTADLLRTRSVRAPAHLGFEQCAPKLRPLDCYFARSPCPGWAHDHHRPRACGKRSKIPSSVRERAWPSLNAQQS